MKVKMAPVEFVQKIKSIMEEQNLGVTQLARKLGVSHPTIVDLVTHGKRPSFDTTLAIAEWLGQDEVATLREAGLLRAGPTNQVNFDDWKYLLSEMTPEEREDLRAIGAMRVERRQKDRSVKSLKAKKAG